MNIATTVVPRVYIFAIITIAIVMHVEIAIACYLFMLNAIVLHTSIDDDDHVNVLMAIIIFPVAIVCCDW